MDDLLIYVARFANTGITLTYDPKEKSIKASIKDEPLFRLMPTGAIECHRPEALKLFYAAIIDDVATLHDSMAFAAAKAAERIQSGVLPQIHTDSAPNVYVAVEISTKDLRTKGRKGNAV